MFPLVERASAPRDFLNRAPAGARQTAILFCGMATFVAYYGACAFVARWGGDIHEYLAAIHALYRNIWSPPHEALGLSGKYSTIYSPYIVTIALIGKALGVSAYRALQIAGIFNLALYVSAIVVFFRTFSASPRSPWPSMLFLVVSLFMRSAHYAWSSETDYLSLILIQAYPSLFGWALALFAFVLTDRAVATRSMAAIGGVTLLIAFLVPTHPITARWVIGIVGLRGLYVVLEAVWNSWRAPGAFGGWQRPLATAALIGGSVFVAIVLSLLWPYYSPFLLFGFSGAQENAPFGANPFSLIPAVYVLALFALLAWPSRVYAFWIAAFAATFGAWATYRLAGVQYGDRYVFFMAFFAQFIVADAVVAASRRVLSSEAAVRYKGNRQRILSGAYVLLFLLAFFFSPSLAPNLARQLVNPRAFWTAPSAERAFYTEWEPLRAVLGPTDMVMMAPSPGASNDVPAVTGAAVVAVPFAFAVPDYADRMQSAQRFFAPGASADARIRELKRWNATKVIVSRSLDLAPEMESLFGPPIWRDETRLVFAVKPQDLKSGD